jgi:hypothetical protein
MGQAAKLLYFPGCKPPEPEEPPPLEPPSYWGYQNVKIHYTLGSSSKAEAPPSLGTVLIDTFYVVGTKVPQLIAGPGLVGTLLAVWWFTTP